MILSVGLMNCVAMEHVNVWMDTRVEMESVLVREGEWEGGREGEWEDGREGEWEDGREGEWEGGREGEWEGGREGEWEGGREELEGRGGELVGRERCGIHTNPPPPPPPPHTHTHTEDPKCRITDSGVNVEIHVGERYYSFVDGDEGSEDDQCRVYSCEVGVGNIGLF